jgi:ribulose-phosphate 3-epimerase
MIVAPSVLSADFANLERDVKMINDSNAEWLHIDIMDGVFVPNISFGLPVTQAIAKHCTKVMDVHLMIVQPDQYISAFKEAGAQILTVHYEACTHLHRTIQKIKAEGMKAGVALNPHTPVGVLEDVLQDLDLVLVMSVNPGFGGQTFIPRTIEKVKTLKRMILDCGSQTLIEIDGGVNADNAKTLKDAGADVVVAGNFVFKHNDPLEAIESIFRI